MIGERAHNALLGEKCRLPNSMYGEISFLFHTHTHTHREKVLNSVSIDYLHSGILIIISLCLFIFSNIYLIHNND